MLKVIVDATPITAKPSGVGFYTANLIKHLYLLQELEQFELSIFYQPSLKNWLKRDSTLPDLFSNLWYQSQDNFFFPIL